MAARTLQELVAAAASVYPDRTAVVFDSGSGWRGSEGPGGPLCLSYRDVSRLAEKLSGVLVKSCPPSSGLVGLYCTDDLFLPVWILGSVRTCWMCACTQCSSQQKIKCGVLLQDPAEFCRICPPGP